MFLIKKQLLMGLFFIPLFCYGYGDFLSVCDRTPQVRDALMEKAAEINPSVECSNDELMQETLSEIRSLSLVEKGIDSLQVGDFSGLSALWELRLSRNEIATFPEGLFSGLSTLRDLYLDGNKMTYFSGAFLSDSGLSSLEFLDLSDNEILYLDDNALSNLPSFRIIDLENNKLSHIPLAFLELPSIYY